MNDGKDWYAWHSPYADEGSPLARRLRLVQHHVATWLDERPGKPASVVSMCAGQGRDILDVLASRPDATRAEVTLIEWDPRNVAAARARAATQNLDTVTVIQADAGDLASYRQAAPADLVIMAGVLGNISDADAHATINALPQLCAADATVIWTRTRRAPDLTPRIRTWLADAGFAEQAFHAPDGVLFSVGVHRFAGTTEQLDTNGKIFKFIA
ncbi:class I SAM-dependent methyltransferase [Micromonospora sp. NIE79]|uniref:Class I SAM-dependent methyltransferase n=1 Tax=Micromonospora trifolii TaxID=2911208 RepID=A0ABS9MVS9_9ACTN|nr:methyltransferase domain-containing protein [Micromonospora trifolii]MCG5441411.1 class I SAM-dependent methyltransferase [Micromonospora trifolii]